MSCVSAPEEAPTDGDEEHLLLHKLVAVDQNDCTFKSYIKAIECYLDESDDHELNEQDSEGRTALHVAVRHGNVEAIVALLMCGADMNVADRKGKTPFSYCLETYDMSKNQCNQMFYVFLGHVHKLVVIGLKVSEENRACYGRARARHVFNDKQLNVSYAIELDKMQDVKVSPSTTLRDVLYEGAHEIAVSMNKRYTLCDIMTSSDFCDEFPKLCCLLKLQYMRGVTRSKLMQRVKAVLDTLADIGLPDPCSETIIKYLDDEDLVNLIKTRV